MNLFRGRIEQGKAYIGPLEFEAPGHAGREARIATLYIRPHQLEIDREDSGERQFRARVAHVNPAGPLVKVDLMAEWGDPVRVELSQERYRALALEAGHRGLRPADGHEHLHYLMPPGWVPAMNASLIAPGRVGRQRLPVARSTLTKTMLPGASNDGGILPVALLVDVGLHERPSRSAARPCAPVSGRPERLLVVVADPDADGQVRVEPGEPRVGVVVGRARLAAERPLERRGRGPVPRCTTPRIRLVITNAVSARIASRGCGRFSSSRLPWRSTILRIWYGFISTPWFGNDRVGGGHLEQAGLGGPERRSSRYGSIGPWNPKRRAYSTTCFGSDLLHRPHGGHVARLLRARGAA